MTADKIDDDIKVLVVIIQPTQASRTQWRNMRSTSSSCAEAKWWLSWTWTSLVDKRNDNPMMSQMPGGGSSLDKLITAWGLHFDSSNVVADLNYKMKLMLGVNGQPE